MLRPIYVVRWNYAPERHFRYEKAVSSLIKPKRAVDVNAHLGVHKELKTRSCKPTQRSAVACKPTQRSAVA